MPGERHSAVWLRAAIVFAAALLLALPLMLRR